ncbi:MAG: type II toxin-antitoxin system RelE/ParE family toxin [Pirellulales bacterium]|nr:type II toxin-antitoxin system RelE/ParE family toxin [Pirellulales bacterium]
MRIKILEAAEQDLLDGFRFYERQSEVVGRYFLDSLTVDLESLHLYAGIHAKQYGYYRMLARRFPFMIYYRIEGDTILVDAVLDARRDPTRIQKRLTH